MTRGASEMKNLISDWVLYVQGVFKKVLLVFSGHFRGYMEENKAEELGPFFKFSQFLDCGKEL